MSHSLSECGWSSDRLGELLSQLAARRHLSKRRVKNPPHSRHRRDLEKMALWVETACDWLGIEAQPATVGYTEVEDLLLMGAPAVLRCPGADDTLYLGLVKKRGRTVVLLGPRGNLLRVPVSRVRSWLCERLERPLVGEIDDLLEATRVRPRRARVARRALLEQRLANARMAGVWLLRPGSDASLRSQFRQVHLAGRLAALVLCHVTQFALWILSWWTIGLAALQGRVDPGLLGLWVLMVLSLVPFRMATTWLQGSISIRGGALLKQRLLSGALRLDPEDIRDQGAGQLLAKVLESEALETLALSGGFLMLLGGLELSMSVAVLAIGAGGPLHGLVLVGWVLLAVLSGRRYLGRRREWTGVRLDLTHALVETMLGYRTRLAQEPRERWHQTEDRQLEGYAGASSDFDRAATTLGAVVPRAWMIIGVAALGPALIAGNASPAGIAVGLGGVLLSFRALGGFVAGMAQLYGASIAWAHTKDLLDAAAKPRERAEPDLALMREESAGRSVLEIQELGFSYAGRPEPVLRSCDLKIRKGDRILLEGASGTGKSTLASVLAGLRPASSGLMLLRGLDQSSVGRKFWRQSVVLAPQFHENHILNESLAFNILMGRRWPPLPEDLAEAEELCRQLGLGDLLNRMPARMFQMVGETGWQLSHGERSRIYIVRTLMQEHDVTILDESFGGLDGESVLQSAKVLLARAPTVVVIGHS